ncbi:MAG: EamA family transporter [Candidatus Aenigmarchaeota archaeon]|nr:EamA family transporter [Candidatus Aenigmarchaeota archaeon]
MFWLILSLLSAFFESVKDLFSKKSLKNIDVYTVSLSFWLFSFPIILIALLITGIPEIKPGFWPILIVIGIIGPISHVLYMKAIGSSELSIVLPVIAFTPLFLLILSPIIVGEFPNLLGFVGVILIVFGSYVLNIKEKSKGYLRPFKMLLTEKGPRLMLIVAFIWALGANFDKIAIKNSSPIFYALCINIIFIIVLSILTLLKSKNPLGIMSSNLKILVPIGFFGGLGFITQMIAINMAYVSYVISIKRLSVIFGVLIGYFVFKEKNIKERLLGSIIMILGTLLIALS